MKKNFLPHLLLAFFLLVQAAPLAAAHSTVNSRSTNTNNFYTSVTALLQGHVMAGGVNYTLLAKSKPELQRLVHEIGDYSLASAPPAERKAFYINAYNVLVLHQVMKYYPIKSVMDVPGFFDKQRFKVAGEQLTLNQLERQKLMVPYQDSRVHFALVCAAQSCPPLLNTAYTPAQVEEQLETQTKKALQDPNFVQVSGARKQVLVSELFKWYRDDFLGEASSVAAYINKYRSRALPAAYRLSYYTYNWALNDSRG